MAEHDRVLSFPAERKLRTAFACIQSWTSKGLERRLCEPDIGLPSAQSARIMICNGHVNGLLLRAGSRGTHIYRINPKWKRPEWSVPGNGYTAEGRAEKPRARASRVVPVLPALGADPKSGPLFPSLGLRCITGVDAEGELLPCVGSRIVDALHRQFHSAFVE